VRPGSRAVIGQLLAGHGCDGLVELSDERLWERVGLPVDHVPGPRRGRNELSTWISAKASSTRDAPGAQHRGLGEAQGNAEADPQGSVCEASCRHCDHPCRAKGAKVVFQVEMIGHASDY
jgi:hypothetical protein